MIKLLILDIDGVLTDGTKHYDHTGNTVYKQYNDKDFTAIKRFKAVGINVCFLSGDIWNKKMAETRNIKFYSGRTTNGKMNKIDVLKIILDEYNIKSEDTIYVGDDIFDIEVFNNVGHAFCPNDSPLCVKKNSKPLNNNGGRGVVSELFDYLVLNEQIGIPLIDDVKNLDLEETTSKKML
tara:strand:+ start:5742 stop:6281 length:540 start_codon:yes stop_codon:yes gene_type:complete